MSNEITGWFYLHENKDLIFKNYPEAIVDIRESDLCHSAWAWDGTRLCAWTILIEALSLGARKERIEKLVNDWKCTDADAVNYANEMNIILGEDGNQKTAHSTTFTNLHESPCGFGNTYLEAMADLCSQLGYKGGKMWNHSFKTLINHE